MQSEIKKAGLISSGGILLILLGIFLLYIKARYDAGAPCLRRDDFYPLSSRNILILASFGAIFIGILIELFGRFKLSQAANDMKIFYNRANFYFAAVLFILLSLLMFENETLFLVKICTNIDYDNPLTLLATGVFIVTSIFLLVLIVYFLLKDSIYLSRVFKSVLPIIAFALGLVSTLLFLGIISSYMPFEIRKILKNFENIAVFVPFLVAYLIIYLKIPAALHEAKDFSFYNYFASNKNRVFWIFCGIFAMYAVYIIFRKEDGFRDLFIIPLIAAPVFFAVSLPLRFFQSPHISKKILLLLFCTVAAYIIFLKSLAASMWLLVFFLLVIPLYAAFCVIVKFQQYNCTKTVILLTVLTCALFGYLVFPY